MKFSLKVSKNIKIAAIAGTAALAVAGTVMTFVGGIQNLTAEVNGKSESYGFGWMNYNAEKAGLSASTLLEGMGQVDVAAADPLKPTYGEILKASNSLTAETKKSVDAIIDLAIKNATGEDLKTAQQAKNMWNSIVNMGAMQGMSIAGLVLMIVGFIALAGSFLLLKNKPKAE